RVEEPERASRLLTMDGDGRAEERSPERLRVLDHGAPALEPRRLDHDGCSPEEVEEIRFRDEPEHRDLVTQRNLGDRLEQPREDRVRGIAVVGWESRDNDGNGYAPRA